MNIRVTGQTQTAMAVANIQRQAAALAKLQDQVSSGVRVAVPSDDPAAYSALFRARAASDRYAAYTQSMSDATSTLDAGVSALGDVNQVLTRAKQIAAEGADASTDAFGYDALASEVDGLIGRALSAANAQQDGRYLFGGTATGTTPFRVAATDASGRPTSVAYDGAAGRGRALIGPGQTMDTRYAGDGVFQKGGADVFRTLIALRDTLRDPALAGAAKSAALNQRLAEVDAARDAVGDTTAEQSSGLATLDAIQSRVGDLKLAVDGRAGELGGTDYSQAVVQMQQEQTALESTLAVSAKLFQPSLLDFIK